MRAARAVQRLFEAAFWLLAHGACRALAWLLVRRAPRAPHFGSERPPRILVVRLEARLGQLLMTTPLVSSLRRRFPTAAIDCVVSPYAARVLLDHPAGIRLLPCQPYTLLAPTSLWRLVRALRRREYDLCLDVNELELPSALQALACRFSGARTVVGYDGHVLAALYDLAVPSAPMVRREAHEIERCLALLAPLGEGPRVASPSVGPLAGGARPAMRAFVEGHRGAPYVVVNLGARAAARRVLPADGALVANMCKSLGFCPVLVAGPGERALCEAVTKLSLDVAVAPEANLADLALLFSRAACTISGDAGPMHLAVALGCPTLTLFSTTSPSRYGYAAAPHAVVGPQASIDERMWSVLVRQFLAGRREYWLACQPQGRRPADTRTWAQTHFSAPTRTPRTGPGRAASGAH